MTTDSGFTNEELRRGFDAALTTLNQLSDSDLTRLRLSTDEAVVAHQALALGVEFLEQEDFATASRYLRMAYEHGIDEARELLAHCEDTPVVASPTAMSRAERIVSAAHTEADEILRRARDVATQLAQQIRQDAVEIQKTPVSAIGADTDTLLGEEPPRLWTANGTVNAAFGAAKGLMTFMQPKYPPAPGERSRTDGGSTYSSPNPQEQKIINQVLQNSQPCYRRIFAVDIEQSTERNNSAKMPLRQAMYDLLEQSMVENGITAPHRDPFVDRGDGILTLIHPADDVPKTLLLSAVIPTLDRLLAEHAERNPEQHLRLRAVVHEGEVHFDGHGWFGEALDVAFRLLDAPEVKKRFRQSAQPLLLVVSEQIYTSIVRHGYAGIDQHSFAEATHIKVAGQRHRGWVR